MRHYVRRIIKVLNKSVAADIKSKETDGFTYHAHRRVPCGYEIVFVIPIGSDRKKVKRQLEAICVAVGTIAEMEFDELYPNIVIVRIVEKDFDPIIPLNKEHLKDNEFLVGYTRNGEAVYHEMERSMLMGGASGMGKTDLIRFIIFQMLLQGYEIFIIDMKRFSFSPFKRFPNLHIAKDLEGAKKLLKYAVAEMDRRADLIDKYDDRSLTKEFTKLAVIVDEAAEIAPAEYSDKADKEIAQQCDKASSHIARLGRELKTTLLYTTQRPSREVINGQVKANVDTKIAFHTSTTSNSLILLDKPGAERIGSGNQGRCIYSGPAGEFVIQVPYVGNDNKWRELLAEMLPDEREQRKDIESAKLRTLGIHFSIGETRGAIIQSEKESIAVVKSTGARWSGSKKIPRPGKDMEFDKGRTKEDEFEDEDQISKHFSRAGGR